MCLGAASPAHVLPETALTGVMVGEDMGDGGDGSCTGERLGSGWCRSVAALVLCLPGNAVAFSFLCAERKET